MASLISFTDPAGNRLEAFHGAQIADTTFKPARDVSGFRTGPQGMGHTLVTVPDIDAALAFYKDLLGFRISDFIVAPLKAYFMHVNARHHSVAFVATPVRSMHHLLVEHYQLDDVGQGYDLIQRTPEKIVATLERPDDVVLHALISESTDTVLPFVGQFASRACPLPPSKQTFSAQSMTSVLCRYC